MFPTKRLPGLRRVAALCLLALGLLLTGATALAGKAGTAAARDGYEYYRIGDLAAARPGTTEPALLGLSSLSSRTLILTADPPNTRASRSISACLYGPRVGS